ncbi:MAG: hypothetical protein WCP18_01360 [bacterium]
MVSKNELKKYFKGFIRGLVSVILFFIPYFIFIAALFIIISFVNGLLAAASLHLIDNTRQIAFAFLGIICALVVDRFVPKMFKK